MHPSTCPGDRGSAVTALAALSTAVALLALTGAVAASGGLPAGSTAAQADADAVDVTGRIVDTGSGRGIDTGRVVLVNRSAGVRFAAATNATGAFEIAVDPNLTYRIRYTQEPNGFPIDGVVDEQPLGTVDVGSDGADLGTEELPEAHRLNVTVVDETGATVPNATVSIRPLAGEGPRGTGVRLETDADGFARLPGRPYTGVEVAGAFRIEVNATVADGPLTQPFAARNVTVGSNRTVTLEVAHEPPIPMPPDVTGDGDLAQDLDGDGRYEDVNGDGAATTGDATVLFEAVFRDDSAVTENVELFDFNADGALTPGDATALFEEVF